MSDKGYELCPKCIINLETKRAIRGKTKLFKATKTYKQLKKGTYKQKIKKAVSDVILNAVLNALEVMPQKDKDKLQLVVFKGPPAKEMKKKDKSKDFKHYKQMAKDKDIKPMTRSEWNKAITGGKRNKKFRDRLLLVMGVQ